MKLMHYKYTKSFPEKTLRISTEISKVYKKLNVKRPKFILYLIYVKLYKLYGAGGHKIVA